MSYKEDHEAFVSNLAGSSIETIILCIAHVPFLCLLLKHVQGNNSPNPLRDFIVFCVPVLCTLTITSQYNYWSILLLAVYLFLVYKSKFGDIGQHINFDRLSKGSLQLKSTYYLTLFKGSNVLVTCLAILAVDFTIFPREFGKTESFGVSLMDAGVGSFIVSSAFTSKYARGIENPYHVKSDTSVQKSNFQLKDLFSKFPFQKLFVLLLGVGRLIVLKIINYQEHVSEYGIHWNFFVTLFCVWSIADMIHCITNDRFRVALIASCHWLVYQMALIETPLTVYMISSVRTNLISANKEGIISLNGYIPLYLIAESLAFYLFFNEGQPISNKTSPVVVCNGDTCSIVEPTPLDCGCYSDCHHNKRTPLTRILIVSGVSWLTWILSTLVQPTSRRLVNVAYCALTLALSLSMVAAVYIVEVLSSQNKSTLKDATDIPLKTIEYMSKHSLMVFLLGNLLTGLVNKTFQTIRMDAALAFVVLVVYTLCLVLIAWGCEKYSKRVSS